MLVTLLIPVTTLVNGKVFLGESIEAKEIVGAIIIGPLRQTSCRLY